MKTLNDYLDDAAEITNSDRQTALKIGVTPQYLSTARVKKFISNQAIVKLAKIINVDVGEIFLSVQIDKTNDKDIKSAAEKILNKLSRSVAAALVLGFSGLMASPADVSAANSNNVTSYTLCVVMNEISGTH